MTADGTRPAIVITGMGMITPIGHDGRTIVANLRAGRSAIAPISALDAPYLVAEVQDFEDDARTHEEDRATRMAKAAARLAVAEATRATGLDLSRIGIGVGMSGSGQYQNMRFTLGRGQARGPEVAYYHDRNVPHFQAQQLARMVGSTGPRVSACSASTGSAEAIGMAMRWLRAGKVIAALVGGAEALTVLTLLGMGSLGIMAKGPTAPFGGAEGITFGEGAAFFVLETAGAATARGAEILAEIQGYGATADGYDPISNDPSGHGLARAITRALRDADVSPRAIDWIRASGTGHREQDLAETLAIKEVFQPTGEPRPAPPVSTAEPLMGHANGASPALGVGLAVLCLRAGLIPATHHFDTPRPGCDLDFVPNTPRAQPIETVLCNCVAFGGANAAIVVGKPRPRARFRPRSDDDVVITGAGIVSPVGHTLDALARAVFEGQPAPVDPPREDCEGPVARVRGWNPRAELPGVDMGRAERVTQFAIVAAGRALADAGFARGRFTPERVGVITGLARGPGVASEKFFDEILRSTTSPALGRFMLRMGRFSVASAAAHALKLLGPTATYSEGTTAGLHALCHAVETLRQDEEIDALVVVSADELSPLGLRLEADAGRSLRAPGGMRLHDPASTGSMAGEGAVALVLERAGAATRRGARVRAQIAGYGLSGALDESSTALALAEAAREALRAAATSADALDLVVGCARGRPAYDRAEQSALERVLAERSRPCPLTALASTIGVSSSASGLFAVVGGLLAMSRGQVPAGATAVPRHGPIAGVEPPCVPPRLARVLVVGGSDEGSSAAVVLSPGSDTSAAPR